MDNNTFRRAAENIACEAGEFIKNSMKRKFSSKVKSAPHDIVTTIDIEAEENIRNALHYLFPSHRIFGEELGMQGENSPYTWIVDPIDGTACFVEGKPGFSVSIALVYNGSIIAGAIYDVMADILYSASLSSGAFINKQILKHTTPLKITLLALRNNAEPYRSKLGEILDAVGILWRYCPSTALALARVAEGNVAGSIKLTYNPWDIAAGVIISREAGCIVTDCFGKELFFNDVSKRNMNGIIAADLTIHHFLLKKISQERVQRMLLE